MPTGVRCGALDVADQGGDKCAFVGRWGVFLECAQSWSGKNRDIYDSVRQAFDLCDGLEYEHLEYDATGVGSGVRGDARVLNEQREAQGRPYIHDHPFLAAGEVHDPDSEMVPGRSNKDFFANLKAMSWWSLRQRFRATHRAVAEGQAVDPDSIISLAPWLPELSELCNELAQPTYSINGAGKILIDKAPDGARSPNLADAVMIAFSPASHAAWAHMWSKL